MKIFMFSAMIIDLGRNVGQIYGVPPGVGAVESKNFGSIENKNFCSTFPCYTSKSVGNNYFDKFTS